MNRAEPIFLPLCTIRAMSSSPFSFRSTRRNSASSASFSEPGLPSKLLMATSKPSFLMSARAVSKGWSGSVDSSTMITQLGQGTA